MTENRGSGTGTENDTKMNMKTRGLTKTEETDMETGGIQNAKRKEVRTQQCVHLSLSCHIYIFNVRPIYLSFFFLILENREHRRHKEERDRRHKERGYRVRISVLFIVHHYFVFKGKVNKLLNISALLEMHLSH